MPEANGEDFESLIAYLQGELASMRAEQDRNQLPELTPDQAFEHGYAAAIHDLKQIAAKKNEESQ